MGKHDNSSVALSQHPQILDEASLKSSHAPGRKGGVFSLPLGAKIHIPELCFGKKESLTCRVATPDTRWLTHPPNLPSYEHINSEMYTLQCSAHCLKKMVLVHIPFQPVDSDFHEVNVKGKLTDDLEWSNITYVVKALAGRQFVELELSKLGTFLVTTRPKTEFFDVTTQGCLYQAKLSRHITVRFPKKAIDQNIQCAIQILPLSSEKVQLARDQYLTEAAEVLSLTEFTNISSGVQCHFRRPITIKLPLPRGVEKDVEGGGSAATGERHQDIAVLYKTSTGWELVESEYKFTRTTVSFDVKELTRFCVLQCLPGRQKKMKDAINLIERMSDSEKGEVCLFLSIKEKSWKALLEVFPNKIADTKISERKIQGFTIVTRVPTSSLELSAATRFSNRRLVASSRTPHTASAADSLELYEGLTWHIYVAGDIKFNSQSDLRENNQLRYFARLSESFRIFVFEPLDTEPRPLVGMVNLVPMGIQEEHLRSRMSFTYKIEIEESTVVDFLVLDTVPEEKEPETPKVVNYDLLPEVPKEEAVPLLPPTPRYREISAQVLQRLTANNRAVRIPERESRALTGKSLMTLARLIPEGLTLAVHLQLPNSTITGIGFDGLSNHLNMSDVSYRILLYWKRKCKDKQMGAVRQLTDALKEMNYHVIAEAILDCHQHHKEFTADCISHEELFARIGVR